LDETPPADAPALGTAISEADRALRRDPDNRLHTGILVTLMLVTTGLFVQHGAVAWAALAGTVLWLLHGVTRGDHRLYARVLRPRLAALVARTGCSPEDVRRSCRP